jgi:hypothetical protein
MPNIELSIPVGLTAAQIIRASRVIHEESAALEIAAELHDFVACVQKSFAAQPARSDPDPLPDELVVSDVVQTLLRCLVNIGPTDKDAADSETMWLAEQLIVGGDDLYPRYMRLYDRVNGTDFVSELELA